MTLITTTYSGPNRVIQPIIYATDSNAGRAMRSAPVILVVNIVTTELGEERIVAKSASVGGPMIPAIPLRMARIRARVLLTLRGPAR